MNIIKFAIRRPITLVCIFIIIILAGLLTYQKLTIDMFPDVNFPIVSVHTAYPGTGPKEIEKLVTRPLERELATISGVTSIKSINRAGISIIIIKFSLKLKALEAERLVKDRILNVRNELPADIKSPKIRTLEPSSRAILTLSVTADIKPDELYRLTDNQIKNLIEQVKNVGYVDIIGGHKREIHVELDLKKLSQYELSASQIVRALANSGKNIPSGKIETADTETIIRSLGEFRSLKDIEDTVISFWGNEKAIKIKDIANVKDTFADMKTQHYLNGEPSLGIKIYKQSGANTLEVVNNIKNRIQRINKTYKNQFKNFTISINQDSSRPIKINIDDVQESIFIGILLVILVVFFFLGNIRSTFITAIAIPNSLIGAFILMYIAGFSINIMTLLAMSLSVGLLIDDAIVVRENIFRHINLGKSPLQAAIQGTSEVKSAVLATSCTILSVFGSIAFVEGIIGQFFQEFGLTICFIIIISTLDALLIAPMLSTYFAKQRTNSKGFFNLLSDKFALYANNLQYRLEKTYKQMLVWALAYRKSVLCICSIIVLGGIFSISNVKKTFLPPQDFGEFAITLELPPKVSLIHTNKITLELDKKIRQMPAIARTVVTVGSQNGASNTSNIYIQLVSKDKRHETTSEVKDAIRKNFTKEYAFAKCKIIDVGGANNGEQPFQVSIIGNNIKDITQTAKLLHARLTKSHHLTDVSISNLAGKPELQIKVKPEYEGKLGTWSRSIGQEIRYLMEGAKPAVFGDKGNEYDILVRLAKPYRSSINNIKQFIVPNLNNRLVKLQDLASFHHNTGPATIYTQDRCRYVQVSASIAHQGKGLGAAIKEVQQIFSSQEIKLPKEVAYIFEGTAEDFQEFIANISLAIILSIILMFLVLASLYESFITPITIMLVIPLAACGAIYALDWANSSIDVFSIIGCILLLGIAAKNSIIQVDYIEKLYAQGQKLEDAIITGCVTRLRPILMTSLAIIAGMIPLAIGLNEVSTQRTSMGIAVIGGSITSTLLTLFVIPAAYIYMKKLGNIINKYAFLILTKPDPKQFNELTR